MAAHPPIEADSLFRAEALHAATDRFGRPLNPFGLSSWVLAAFLLLVLVCVATFLAHGTYTRKETVPGSIILSGGAPRVVSARPGLIESVHVIEGQRVVTGEVLFTIAMDAMRPEGGNVGEELKSAVADQGDARVKDLLAQVSRVVHQQEEIGIQREGLVRLATGLDAEFELQEQRVALSELTVRDLKPLFEAQHLAALQYRQYEATVLEARQTLAALDRERQAATAQIRQLHASESAMRDEQASLAARIDAEVALQRERQVSLDGDRRFAITAPVDGVVTSITAQPGAPVIQNGTLAVVVPEGARLQAELWVPSRALGFIRSGHKVKLMYDAFPYQRFGFGDGVVTFVSNAPVLPADLSSTLAATEPMFRIQVSVAEPMVRGYGEARALTPGMRLSADLVLEERTFLDWILDPIRAASMRS